MIATIQINQQRLWENLKELGEIGASSNSEEGITRLALSLEDLKAREYVIRVMKESGLDVRVDSIGNIIGKFEGADPTAPVIMTGSHVDTVIQGGLFDGALGVLGAIEAVRSIKESGIKLKHSIEVISFTDEEGTRFGSGYIGSKALTGYLDEQTLQIKDASGITYAEALQQAGFDPTCYKEAIRKPEEIKAYLEMHIEQGKVLEENELPVGIVTNIQGPVWLEVTLTGHPDHAGATPMHMRKDASLAMAEIMLEVERIASHYEGVGTVGRTQVEPGGVNIIPGKAVFTIDLRHGDKERRTNMVKEITDAIEWICEKRDIQVEVDFKKSVDPATCSEKIINVLEQTCAELKVPTMKLPCGAGHDSLMMTKITDMGMIFVRSKDGISHNPKEWTDKEDCIIGSQVLLQALIKLAK
ncbi:N-carbamoyl-L-amino acid hydrolase [Halalkalibacter wakoensis JCM 9140]|uniref:N-carbamoyl-L-amino acid hydrolase n=1 Tax=Halalkalibacter wakoensis JCM 9140 TaxID=1236970 RepID=W4Q290_9BACI|nr:Zn-dependent hydrolase [Halalkalibacter wakoensis]GAE26102.1 N-carbamoyl-L-amino acid hydrolase [Halalkalibacter wakoensis JCM 9140]